MKRRIGTVACWVLASACGDAALAQTASYPMLEQLDRETKALCAQMQESVVRVGMPPPKWVNELVAKDNPLNKWKDLDPAVRKKLEEHVRMAQSGEFHQVNATVTAPATQPAATTTRVTVPIGPQPTAGGSLTILAPIRIGEEIQYRPLTLTFPNHVGVVMDTQGHVLVPLFVEREVVAGRTLPVVFADGHTAHASFVGSDRMMNLTVLQLDAPAGKPVRITDGKPPAGGLVMMVSPSAPPVMRLSVWTGGMQDLGLVAGMDGGVFGFARFGHFLQLADAKPVVEQLVRHGEIKRAQLGVWVQEVTQHDELRQQVPALANRPAPKVLDVTPGSAAHQAGLKVNDLILTLSDKAVGDTSDFAIAISHSSGPTDLRIIRGNEESTIRVELKPQ